MRRLLLIPSAVACALMLAALAPVGARANLDTSYGSGGVVEVVRPTFWEWPEFRVEQLVAGRQGDAYVVARGQTCPREEECAHVYDLLHYLPDGALDYGFGGGRGFVELNDYPVLRVDSQGRPLVANSTANSVVVSRLTKRGAVDRRFGNGGSARISCSCSSLWVQLQAGPRGRVTVVLTRVHTTLDEKPYRTVDAISLILLQLRGDGSRESRFGRRGISRIDLPGISEVVPEAVAEQGGLYLRATFCCEGPAHGTLLRVSAKGSLDTRFRSRVERSLHRLDRVGEEWTFARPAITGVVLRPHGKLDLVGRTGLEGLVLRLDPRGNLVRRFGRRGLVVLDQPLDHAVLGGDGALVGLSETNYRDGAGLLRLLPGGRLDPGFGTNGFERLPVAGGGMSLAALSGGKVLVMEQGWFECRSYCPPKPSLIRFDEAPQTP